MQYVVRHGRDAGASYDLSNLDSKRQAIIQWQNTQTKRTQAGFGATGDDDGISWSQFLSTLTTEGARAWTAITNAQLQSQLLELNLQRAANNQPMIKMPGISVGADTTTLLVVGGIGVALALAVIAHGRGRR